MVDVDTFITILYVMVDDFCQSHPITQDRHPGPQVVLPESEVVTLALFGQWAQFGSKRAFYRYAEPLSRRCKIAANSIGCNDSVYHSSRRLACIWSACWMLGTASMNALIRRVLPHETLSDVEPYGCRVRLTLAEVVGSAGMKVFTCWSLLPEQV